MLTQPLFRPKISSEAPTPTDLYAWGAPHDGKGVLRAPVPRQDSNQKLNVTARIFQSLFGAPQGQPDLARNMESAATPKGAFYTYHVGDIFTPGTENYIFQPTTELTPLNTIWGNAFLRQPNTFRPLQPPQVDVSYQKNINGIGGLVAGQYALQPLASYETQGG